MPGLLRGVARTAVVAGTATAVSGRVQRRQASRYADKDAETAAVRQQAYEEDRGYSQTAPEPQATAGANRLDDLKALGDLKAQGVLTEEEFAREKAKILSA